ncbi:MAG: thermostable hemolysin [Rhodomicrobium sp.]
MRLLELTIEHPLMPAAYRLIRAVYALSYDACVTCLPKTVIALVDSRGKIHAAAGFRDSSEPYFSEYYLDAPIDAVIGRVARKRVERDKIVEVSSLASRTPAISVHFLRELVLYGEELGYDWAFFTATSRLEKLLRRMRLPLINLGAASASRVPTPAIWGSYYETDPRVLAFGREQLAPFLMKTAARAEVHEVRAHG